MKVTSQSIREAIDKIQGMKSEPLVNSISANLKTIERIKKQFPSRLKDDKLAYMYGIKVLELSILEDNVCRFDFNDGTHKYIRI